MKNKCKKFIILVLISILLICVGWTNNSYAAVYSGSCGSNVKWTLNQETGVLNITGTGAMSDYGYFWDGNNTVDRGNAPWYNYRNYIQQVIIGNKVTTVGDYSFYDCEKMEKVTFPNTLTKIGEYAFEMCEKLNNVVVPNSVTELGREAFYYCTSLKNIKLSNKITEIPEFCFTHSGISNLNIPSNVESIELGAYEDCKNITNCVIPDNVRLIDGFAFSGCLNIKNVVLSKNLTSIGMDIFENNTLLTQITIPYNVTEISDEAFDNSKIKTIIADKGSYAQLFANKNGFKFVPVIPFTDVRSDAWYFSAVKNIYDRKIISGETSTRFSPNKNLSRGMLVTILWRMEGCPKVSSGKNFTDVKSSIYYATPIKWASATGVVNGYNNKSFGPDDNITREQLAVMLRNYANYKEKNTKSLASIESFKDNGQVSKYAREGVQWAVKNKIINGKTTKNGTIIDPRGNASRAEGSAMICNYMNQI